MKDIYSNEKLTFDYKDIDIEVITNAKKRRLGFRALWPVPSSVATTLPGWFWNFLGWRLSEGNSLEGGMIAQALHMATIEAAFRSVNDPLMWASFIHIGGMSGDASDDGVKAAADRSELAEESGEAKRHPTL